MLGNDNFISLFMELSVYDCIDFFNVLIAYCLLPGEGSRCCLVAQKSPVALPAAHVEEPGAPVEGGCEHLKCRHAIGNRQQAIGNSDRK